MIRNRNVAPNAAIAVSKIQGAGLPAYGRIMYVAASTSAMYSYWSSMVDAADLFTTIGDAITASTASQGDVIIVAPETYTVTSAIVPKAYTSIIAAVQPTNRVPSVKISGNIADVVQVDVDGVYFEGIEFLAAGNTADNLVDVADSAAVSGLTFKNCVFNGADKTSVIGINAADATNAVTGLTVTGCLFRDLTGTCLNVGVQGMPYAYVAYNQFAIDVNSGVGIALADTSAFATGKGYVIEHNDFTGFDATADEVGISIAGTENTTGAGIIRNNYFSYLAAAAITIDKLSKSEVNNYVGDAGTGGTLVDPGT